MHLKTHLLLRIDTFEKMGTTTTNSEISISTTEINEKFHFAANESNVIVREGATSESTLLEHYDWPRDKIKPFTNLVTTLSSGFYVSFRGVFDESTRFAIIYTAFSYMGKRAPLSTHHIF